MPSDRLRRVNEAVRQVLSDAITQDLKDPLFGTTFQPPLTAQEGLRYLAPSFILGLNII